jgi:UDP-N-acetylmuramate dehydrogenase
MTVRGELLHQVSMADYCSWRTGGPVKTLFQPADVADLAAFLATLPVTEPLLWLGLGSNLLVRDGGFPGTAILMKSALQDIRFLGEDKVRAEAGVTCAKLARVTAREGYSGLEFFAGIPGTVGGALAMNAGAFDSETWRVVTAVETIDRQGVVRHRKPDDFSVHYREVEKPAEEWFVAGEFLLQSAPIEEVQERIRNLLATRSANQPTTQPSCGSTFRNPPNDYAARLIEAAGLKGFCIGGACVSDKHANFLINQHGASAADLEALIQQVQESVEEHSGIRLQTEVHIVGEAL